jgi:hypothetical protein
MATPDCIAIHGGGGIPEIRPPLYNGQNVMPLMFDQNEWEYCSTPNIWGNPCAFSEYAYELTTTSSDMKQYIKPWHFAAKLHVANTSLIRIYFEYTSNCICITQLSGDPFTDTGSYGMWFTHTFQGTQWILLSGTLYSNSLSIIINYATHTCTHRRIVPNYSREWRAYWVHKLTTWPYARHTHNHMY